MVRLRYPLVSCGNGPWPGKVAGLIDKRLGLSGRGGGEGARARSIGQDVDYRGWPGVVFGDESSPVGGTVGVDPESQLVDGDVMVIPAEGYQVCGVVAPAPGSLLEVVGLEPVTASTPFDRTLPLVPPQDVAPDPGRDRFSQIGIGHRVEAVGDDHPDLAVTEDLREGVGSHPGPGGDPRSCFPVAFGG